MQVLMSEASVLWLGCFAERNAVDKIYTFGTQSYRVSVKELLYSGAEYTGKYYYLLVLSESLLSCDKK